jgi:hypothetical protein
MLLLLAGASVFAAWALGGTHFFLVPTSDGLWSGVSDPPGLTRLLYATLAGVVTTAALRGRPSGVIRPFLFLLLATAPLVPLFTRRLAIALVFQGPGLVLVETAVLSVVVVRSLRLPRLSSRFVAPILFVVGFGFQVIAGRQLEGAAGPQGDEPHYLLACESLLRDGDLDLANQYRAHPSLGPHVSLASVPGHTYLSHGPGLPMLLLPAYALGGQDGVHMFLAAVTAMTGVLVYRLVRTASDRQWVAVAVWLLVTLTPPLGAIGTRIYPDIVAAMACAVFLLSAREGTMPQAVSAVVLAAALPWLHSKFLVFAIVGLAMTLWRVRRPLFAVVSLALFVVSMAELLSLFRRFYGTASFSAPIYGSTPPAVLAGPIPLLLAVFTRGTTGLLFDRVFGLFVFAPVWFLSVPAFLSLVRRDRATALRVLLLVGSIVGVTAGFNFWSGGLSVPARYCLPFVPALAVTLAAVLPEQRIRVAAFGGLQVGILLLGLRMPWIFHVLLGGESPLLRGLSPYVDLGAIIPSITDGGPEAVSLALLLCAVGIVVWRYRWKGLAVGAIAYSIAAACWSDRPLISRREVTADLLMRWEPQRAAVPSPSSLDLPFDLRASFWDLRPGVLRISRPLEVPPGRYRVAVDATFPAIGVARAMVTVYDDDIQLATLPIDQQTARTGTTISLPIGAQHLRASAQGLEGAARVTDVHLIPEAVVPVSQRGPV